MSGIISKGLKESFLLTNHGDNKKGAGYRAPKAGERLFGHHPLPLSQLVQPYSLNKKLNSLRTLTSPTLLRYVPRAAFI